MSTFIHRDITNAGRVLIAKSFLGEKINFTRIAMGQGTLPDGQVIAEMTDVIDHVIDVSITKLRITGETTVSVGGLFSNSEITTEFFYRELALFAEGDDSVEILYCYANAAEFAELIPPVGGSSVTEKAIDIVTAIGTTENVTANITRATTADEISYNDSISGLGAGSVQEAVEILAQQNAARLPVMIISETEPAAAYEFWLKPTGETEFTPDGATDPEEEPEPETQTLFFYLAHYYDKANNKYVPFMHTNTAQNVLMTPGGTESVADAIVQLNNARISLLSELFSHIGNPDVHVTAGQVDNIFAALGEIILHVEDFDIHVTLDDKGRWDTGAQTAEEALALAGVIGGIVEYNESRLGRLEDSVFSNITANPFSISFDTLAGINLAKGIWNRERERIEC